MLNFAGTGVSAECPPPMMSRPLLFVATCILLLGGHVRAQEPVSPAPPENAAPAPAPSVAVTTPAVPAPVEKAEHVVVMVWDGMRPDFVTEQFTPNLYRLAHAGVTFAHHHPTYPSSTEVNGAALATGDYPSRSGLIANHEFRPAINPKKPISTEKLKAVRQGDEVSSGKYLTAPTVAELVQAAGFRTAVAGTKPVALLLDRAEERSSEAARASVDLFEGDATPAAALAPVLQAVGAFPPVITFPNTAQDAWTTRALTEFLWKDSVPKYSVLWCSDPDYSQHDTAPGSEKVLGALKSDDDNLQRVLDALEAKGVRGKTDVFVVSDHGFSTISETVDVAALLTQAGFNAGREFHAPPKPGDILVASLGGSVACYVTGHDAGVTRRLVDFFQGSAFAGVIFTRETLDDAFTLAQAHIDTAAAPDVMVALRWTEEKNAFGAAGMVFSDLGRKAGQGTHASLSAFDMHNTLIAAGPDFRPGMIDELPSGNADLAPTILSILGIAPPQPLDGRVLSEAMTASADASVPKMESIRLEVAHETEHSTWRQFLQISKVGGETYLSEGNGGSVAK